MIFSSLSKQFLSQEGKNSLMLGSGELVAGCLQRGCRKPMEARQTEVCLQTRLGSRGQCPSTWVDGSRDERHHSVTVLPDDKRGVERERSHVETNFVVMETVVLLLETARKASGQRFPGWSMAREC